MGVVDKNCPNADSFKLSDLGSGVVFVVGRSGVKTGWCSVTGWCSALSPRPTWGGVVRLFWFVLVVAAGVAAGLFVVQWHGGRGVAEWLVVVLWMKNSGNDRVPRLSWRSIVSECCSDSLIALAA